MSYTVLIMPAAERELDQAYEWLVSETPQHAGEWHDGLVDAILSLENSPARCPLVPESRSTQKARQLLYGNKRPGDRIIFTIRGETVLVLHIVHAARGN